MVYEFIFSIFSKGRSDLLALAYIISVKPESHREELFRRWRSTKP
ncbi:1096_t:CDS:2 [Rhizophagus irregularis]|nr:1096_t:CDS:2 [Rhizophagus irregularis]